MDQLRAQLRAVLDPRLTTRTNALPDPQARERSRASFRGILPSRSANQHFCREALQSHHGQDACRRGITHPRNENRVHSSFHHTPARPLGWNSRLVSSSHDGEMNREALRFSPLLRPDHPTSLRALDEEGVFCLSTHSNRGLIAGESGVFFNPCSSLHVLFTVCITRNLLFWLYKRFYPFYHTILVQKGRIGVLYSPC